ncbi:MAG: hypothetical protein ACPL09_03395 [Candidatus Methanodesulfokora sp.]
MEEAFKEAENVVLEAIRRGKYEEAARMAFREVFKPLFDLVHQIGEKVDRSTENIDKLTEKVERNTENINKLTKNVNKLLGETGRLRGRDVEFRTGLMLQGWFRRYAPEYEVFMWDGTGADVIVEGRGVLASVKIAIKPKKEDVEQLKRGIGAIMENWGRKPDLLILYSRSGVIPERVARFAAKMGVKIARKSIEVKKMLDEIVR